MWLVALEWATIAVVALLLVTQLVVPVVMGRPMFPMFRREWGLRRRLDELRQTQAELDLSKRVESEERTLNPEQPTTKQPTTKE